MSLGYAEKLSYREDVGEVGQKEYVDSEEIIEQKSLQLADLARVDTLACCVLVPLDAAAIRVTQG
jgi:hypothetical protein